MSIAGGGPLYAPDSISRTVQIEPAARFESSRPTSGTSQHKAIGPIRPKSSQCKFIRHRNFELYIYIWATIATVIHLKFTLSPNHVHVYACQTTRPPIRDCNS